MWILSHINQLYIVADQVSPFWRLYALITVASFSRIIHSAKLQKKKRVRWMVFVIGRYISVGELTASG